MKLVSAPKYFLKSLFRAFGYEIRPIAPEGGSNKKNELVFRNFLKLYFSRINSDEFFFLNIGANDGKHGDAFYEFVTEQGLRGLFVEPQKDVFARLQANYAGQNVQCVNVAIAHSSGTAAFYSIRDSFKNTSNFETITLGSSLKRDVFVKTLRPKIPSGAKVEDYVQEHQVETASFQDLVSRYNIRRIDLIQIDCEGFDYEVVKMIDLERFSPSLINYESKHLTGSDARACEDLLRSHGYEIFTHGADTTAFK